VGAKAKRIFLQREKMNSPLNKGRCRQAEGIFFLSGMINIFNEYPGYFPLTKEFS
jgi:hypothetical protein